MMPNGAGRFQPAFHQTQDQRSFARPGPQQRPLPPPPTRVVGGTWTTLQENEGPLKKEEDKRVWSRIEPMIKRMRLDRSDCVPKTIEQYKKHRREFEQDVADDVERREYWRRCEEEQTRILKIPPILLFHGRELEDERRGAVLGLPTIWAPNWYPDEEHPEAQWPTPDEFREEGGERHTSGYGRFLPLPRVPAHHSVTYKQRLLLPTYPLDVVSPVPHKYPDIRLPCDGPDPEPKVTCGEDGVPIDDDEDCGRAVEVEKYDDEDFGHTVEVEKFATIPGISGKDTISRNRCAPLPEGADKIPRGLFGDSPMSSDNDSTPRALQHGYRGPGEANRADDPIHRAQTWAPSLPQRNLEEELKELTLRDHARNRHNVPALRVDMSTGGCDLGEVSPLSFRSSSATRFLPTPPSREHSQSAGYLRQARGDPSSPTPTGGIGRGFQSQLGIGGFTGLGAGITGARRPGSNVDRFACPGGVALEASHGQGGVRMRRPDSAGMHAVLEPDNALALSCIAPASSSSDSFDGLLMNLSATPRKT